MEEESIKIIFANNLKALRKKKELSQQELADFIGSSKTSISEWEAAKKLPNAGSIEKISAFFNIPKSALFAVNDDRYISYDKIYNLPIIGKISCGNGVFAYEEIEDYEPTPGAWINGAEHFYLRVNGDSMKNVRINDGDLALIRSQPRVEDGEIAAVLIDGEAYLKRVYYRKDTLVLQSENPKYPPKFYDPENQECIIIGKLKRIVISY
jgi:repressor LexA